jgi:hemolysin activation/secretion protein
MTRNLNSLGTLVVVAWALAPGSMAFAQAAGPTREEVNPPAPVADVPKNQVRVDADAAFQAGPCPLAESDIRTSIKEVRFTAPGGGALAPELLALLTDVTTSSEEQPLRVVCDLRDLANARLRRARYVASVQIPPQRIGDGVLRLEVVSGRIVEVRVRGDAGPYEGLLRNRIELLKGLTPLNSSDAERILLLANDVPGMTVQLGLSPKTSGGVPGDLIGELSVTYRRFSLIGNVQNYNSVALGRETGYLRAEFFGLTGMGDRGFVAGSSSFDFKEQRIVQGGYSIALDSAGTRLGVTGTLAFSRPDLETLDLRTRSLILNIEASRPLIRSLRKNASVALGFDYVGQRTRVHASGSSFALSSDKISTIYTRIGGDTRKLRFDGSLAHSLSVGLELRQGLGIFGATKTGIFGPDGGPSRFEGSAKATVVRGDVSGTIGFGPIFELAATGRGQWTNKPLLNYDEFAIGNLTMGRGYDPGANTGDRMVGGSVEARANIGISPKARGQIYGFYDGVKLWNLDLGSTEKNRYLASVGGGVRMTLFNSLRLDVTYAHPLDPPLLTGVTVTRAPDRVMASLTAQIIPFGSRR